MKQAMFEKLNGLTIESMTGTEKDSEMIKFSTSDGRTWELYHEVECCEDVRVEEVIGDIDDLIGSPILLAEEVTREAGDEEITDPCNYSGTWTFYKLSTIEGSVTIRWLGQSSGYYSESVDLYETKPVEKS